MVMNHRHYKFPKLEDIAAEFVEKNKLPEPYLKEIRQKNLVILGLMLIFPKEGALFLYSEYDSSSTLSYVIGSRGKEKKTVSYNLTGNLNSEEINLNAKIVSTQEYKCSEDNCSDMPDSCRVDPIGRMSISKSRQDNNRNYWFITRTK
jgi:hypothetical protein